MKTLRDGVAAISDKANQYADSMFAQVEQPNPETRLEDEIPGTDQEARAGRPVRERRPRPACISLLCSRGAASDSSQASACNPGKAY